MVCPSSSTPSNRSSSASFNWRMQVIILFRKWLKHWKQRFINLRKPKKLRWEGKERKALLWLLKGPVAERATVASTSFLCLLPTDPSFLFFSNLKDQCLQQRFPSSPMVPILIADECACLAPVDLSGMKPSHYCLLEEKTEERVLSHSFKNIAKGAVRAKGRL